MKLYSYWRSTSAWRVRIVLAWKGLEYDCIPVNLAPDVAGQRSTEFGVVNPLRQVPSLEWPEGDRLVRLSQSVAIAEYLDERHPNPPLFPREPLARARVRQSVEIVNSGIQPLQNSTTMANLRELTGEPEVLAWARTAIGRGLAALEALSRDDAGVFLVGNAPTLADMYLVPQLYNARRFEVDLNPFPKLRDVETHASELEAFQSARPERQPDAPQ